MIAEDRNEMSIYNFSSTEHTVYRLLRAGIDAQRTIITIPKAEPEQVTLIYKKAISESMSGLLYESSSLHYILSGMNLCLYLEFCPESESRIAFFSRIEFEVSEIIESACRAQNAYEQIIYVYKYFVEHFSYVKHDLENEKFHRTSSPFLYRKAVCEGFAFALSHIYNRMGIPCGIIMGFSTLAGTEGPHAWNIIKFDGKYYHIDVTWDICTKEKGLVVLDYCMLDDNLISKDHYWYDKSIPKCIDLSMEFYSRQGRICFTEDDIIEILRKDIQRKKQKIYFRYLDDKLISIVKDGNLQISINNVMRFFGYSYSAIKCRYNENSGTIVILINYSV